VSSDRQQRIGVGTRSYKRSRIKPGMDRMLSINIKFPVKRCGNEKFINQSKITLGTVDEKLNELQNVYKQMLEKKKRLNQKN